MKCEPAQKLSGYFKVPLIIIVTMCLFYPVGSQLDWIKKTGTFKYPVFFKSCKNFRLVQALSLPFFFDLVVTTFQHLFGIRMHHSESLNQPEIFTGFEKNRVLKSTCFFNPIQLRTNRIKKTHRIEKNRVL